MRLSIAINQNAVIKKIKSIKLLILDVDGVLTDTKLYVTNDGQVNKAFSSKDGIGMKLLLMSGIKIAIISGGNSDCVNHRMKSLGVEYVYQNQKDKMVAFNELKSKLNLENSQIAYVGDDLPDLIPIMSAGFGIAVLNACELIKGRADYITKKEGGKGAVREICDQANLKNL